MPLDRGEAAQKGKVARNTPLQEMVVAKVALIEKATIVQMREIWETELVTPVPPIRAYETLRRILAWRVQEKYLGGLSQNSLQELERLGKALERNPGRSNPALRLRPGVTLVREWKGTKHHVRVLPGGFEYLGKTYDSLSIIARTIAGTRWSGPLFFGLKDSKTNKARKK